MPGMNAKLGAGKWVASGWRSKRKKLKEKAVAVRRDGRYEVRLMRR